MASHSAGSRFDVTIIEPARCRSTMGEAGAEVPASRCDSDLAYRDTFRAPGNCQVVRVFFHVYTDQAGPQAISTANLAILARDAAAYYAAGNVTLEFPNLGAPDIITSADADLNTRRFRAATRRNNQPDALDVYVFRQIEVPHVNGPSTFLCGRANAFGPGVRSAASDGVAFSNSPRCGDPRTLAHEIGHYLGLSHTFQDFDSEEDPDDCALVGDRCCDTAPDCGRRDPGQTEGCAMPAVPVCVLLDCQGCASDPATPWVPDPDTTGNLLSYFAGCRDHFTGDQFARIRCFVNEEAPHALDVQSCDPNEEPPTPDVGVALPDAAGNPVTPDGGMDATVDASVSDAATVDAIVPPSECAGHIEGDILGVGVASPPVYDGPCATQGVSTRIQRVCRGGVAVDVEGQVFIDRPTEGIVIEALPPGECEPLGGEPCAEVGLQVHQQVACRAGVPVDEEAPPEVCRRETEGDLIDSGDPSECVSIDGRCDNGVSHRTEQRCVAGVTASLDLADVCRLDSADDVDVTIWSDCAYQDVCLSAGLKTRTITACGDDGQLTQTEDTEGCSRLSQDERILFSGPWSVAAYSDACDMDGERPWIRIVRYVCASCSATWRILPLLVARHLWRSWRVVERIAEPPATLQSRSPAVPARTSRRWSQRLASAALLLTQALARRRGRDGHHGAWASDHQGECAATQRLTYTQSPGRPKNGPDA